MTSNAHHGAGKRLDLQGLRALAVLVVVLYHAGVPMPGGFVGVDLFFVLSGFLIVGTLVSESERGRIRLGEFWARRARRLIPAATLVLVTTLAVASAVSSFLDQKKYAADAIWSALFSANWRFAFSGDDYMADDSALSPFRHYWSLAVEEQFYIVAPVVIIVMAAIAKALHNRWPSLFTFRRVVGALLSVVAAASLAYCVWVSATNPSVAYYDTGARAWQLAAGGVLAVAMSGRRIGTAAATSFAIAGLGLLGWATFFFAEGGDTYGLSYPSLLALIPTIGGAFLIAAGLGSNVISTVLSVRPLTYIGDVSYSLYLWHWPFLVLGWQVLGTDALSKSLMLVAGSLLASVVTYHLVENPIRHSKGLRIGVRPVASVVMGASLLVVTVGVSSALEKTELDPTRHASAAQIGTMELGDEKTGVKELFDDSVADVQPALDRAPKDEVNLREKGCQIDFDDARVSDVESCTFGNPAAENRVFIVGDSISSAVFPAVREAAGDNWSITVLAKSACTLAEINRYRPNQLDTPWGECTTWRRDVTKTVLSQKPDLVIVGASENSLFKVIGSGGKPTPKAVAAGVKGLRKNIARFMDADIPVALVQSPVVAPFDLPECLADKLSVKKCAFRAEAPRVTDQVAATTPGLMFIETMDAYCETECMPVVDRRIVFRDSLHFTKTFSLTYTDRFGEVLDDARV